ncbi:aldo-keto reductase IolS-like [Teleopsis dalmanni]|uniref:aldo-keto reductase IolS-like n=1 Tax=Teleopsis dalmanni TaxID=139649 RepID=UPI0018CFD4EB|nr:aldo-keto reductase IolS-like [Teleopsis dalmanni]
MENVQLGNTDLQIAPIIFGGNVFGWTLNEEESFRILDIFIDRGFNTIDTSNNYSHWVSGNVGTESEKIIGKWLKERNLRDKIVLATKVGEYNLYDRQHFEEFLRPVAEKYNLAVIPYYSLASGFLSGKYKSEEDLENSARKDKYNVSYSAISLAWLLKQQTVVAPIASATKENHIDSFIDAVQLNLSEEDLAILNEASTY